MQKKKLRSIFNNPARQIIFSKPSPVFALFSSLSIFWEFFTGFLFLSNFGKAVSFFGSARETLPEKYYKECEEIASILSNKNFSVITGGSGGIMRSANKGAYRVGGESVGININLPEEQVDNNFLTHKKDYNYFFSRKTILSCASEIYVFFPGGFGTLDELFEMLTMVQTNHSENLPIILYGKEYWNPLVDFIEKQLCDKYKTISESDRKLFIVLDSVNEVEHYVDSIADKLEERTCKIGPQKMKDIMKR